MQSITFEQWTAITNSTQFIIVSLIFFLVPFIIYLIIGAVVSGKSSSGKSMTKPMIMYGNFWFAPLIYILIGLCIYIGLIVYPFWLNLF